MTQDPRELYQTVIGIEVHVQLKTKSKLFCSCQNLFGSTPNSNICKVCTGMLGSLPVLNVAAVNHAISAGLATGCSISKISEFARKHYMYPDLPKNYQITQDDKPVCQAGFLDIKVDNKVKRIRINRIHLEEDAGKNIHGEDLDSSKSFLDLNRAGTPLIEIVTEPDISSAEEAVAYLEALKSIIEYTGVSDADMEKGSFRADVNISVKKKEASQYGQRVELKNINSIKFIYNAIKYEEDRHVTALENGEKITQETRLWDDKKGCTVFMRSKESAHDYRYMLEPDLPMLIIDDDWVSRMQESLPELPNAKRLRFIEQYDLSEYEANILTSDRKIADYFEMVVSFCKSPKKSANWILRDVLGFVKENKVELRDMLIKPEMLAELISELDRGVINSKVAQEIFAEMSTSGKYPSIIIQEKGLVQIGSEDELGKIVDQVIAENPQQSEQFRMGNERIFGFLVGQAMKLSKGKANPSVLNKIFKDKLK